IFEHAVRKLERVTDAVGIDLRAQPLRDHIDVVILKVLCDARNKRDAHRGGQQQADSAEKLARRVFAVARRVFVDDVAKDHRIQKREDLVDRRQNQYQDDRLPMFAEIRVKNFHAGDFGIGQNPYFKLEISNTSDLQFEI